MSIDQTKSGSSDVARSRRRAVLARKRVNYAKNRESILARRRAYYAKSRPGGVLVRGPYSRLGREDRIRALSAACRPGEKVCTQCLRARDHSQFFRGRGRLPTKMCEGCRTKARNLTEHARERTRAYARRANPKQRAIEQGRYQEFIEKRREKGRRHYHLCPGAKEMVKIRSRIYKGRAGSPARPDLIAGVLGLSTACVYCGATFDPSSSAGRRSWDHQDPVSAGGRSVPEKAIPVCVSCNSSRGATPMIEWFNAAPQAAQARLLAFIRKRNAFLKSQGYTSERIAA